MRRRDIKDGSAGGVEVLVVADRADHFHAQGAADTLRERARRVRFEQLKSVLFSNIYAARHQLLGQAASPCLLIHGDDPAFQNFVHLKRVEQVQFLTDRVQDGEYLVVLLVRGLLDLLDRLLDVSGS